MTQKISPEINKRLLAGRYLEDILESYELSIMDFSDEEINHFIDLILYCQRDLAVSIVCEYALKRLAFGN